VLPLRGVYSMTWHAYLDKFFVLGTNLWPGYNKRDKKITLKKCFFFKDILAEKLFIIYFHIFDEVVFTHSPELRSI